MERLREEERKQRQIDIEAENDQIAAQAAAQKQAEEEAARQHELDVQAGREVAAMTRKQEVEVEAVEARRKEEEERVAFQMRHGLLDTPAPEHSPSSSPEHEALP